MADAKPFFLEDEEGDEEARRPIEQQLQRELVFVQEHEATLRGIELAITDATAQVPREDHSIPVRFHFHPTERVPALELVNTGEKFLRKVLAVFAYLCDEIHELSEVAEAHFFPRLAMFGEPLSGDDDDDGGESRRDAFGSAPASREIAVGRLVPFLQELSNFVERCHACCVNMVHQLAALYNPREKLHQSTFKHTRLTVAYRSLGDLLQLLITLDGVIARNEALHGAWNDYKRMMQYVRARPDEFALGAPGGGGAAAAEEAGEPPRAPTTSRLEKFERLLVHLDKTVMSSACFRGCIEQDFEDVALAGSENADDEEADAAPMTVSVRKARDSRSVNSAV